MVVTDHLCLAHGLPYYSLLRQQTGDYYEAHSKGHREPIGDRWYDRAYPGRRRRWHLLKTQWKLLIILSAICFKGDTESSAFTSFDGSSHCGPSFWFSSLLPWSQLLNISYLCSGQNRFHAISWSLVLDRVERSLLRKTIFAIAVYQRI